MPDPWNEAIEAAARLVETERPKYPEVAIRALRRPEAEPEPGLVEAIERELDVVEMLQADPLTLRRLKAQRIARAAMRAARLDSGAPK